MYSEVDIVAAKFFAAPAAVVVAVPAEPLVVT
jgi:hypothetical protein